MLVPLGLVLELELWLAGPNRIMTMAQNEQGKRLLVPVSYTQPVWLAAESCDIEG